MNKEIYWEKALQKTKISINSKSLFPLNTTDITKKLYKAIKEVNEDTTGLWFFNSGPLAGASQPHRHIQLLRRDPSELSCPRERWILDFDNENYKNQRFYKNIILKKFSKTLNKENIHEIYKVLSYKLGLGKPEIDKKPRYPYNLIFTNHWMLLIKRKTDNLYGISVNALGFAGYILVTEKSDINYLKKIGPEKLLENFL